MNSIGRYQIVEKLGQGGMGVVYRAFDTLLHRVVAVKVISGALDANDEQRERFFREARAAGQLSHRNIITIHDLGEHEGQPYLAMEFLEGEDLQRRLLRPDPMSLARKVDLAIDICQALEYAHTRGVIHRDVKPANIFITDNGTTKILDFGLARLVSSELTDSKMMMGTINYMAPEQVRGQRADHRSDIFSVGVVLYELLGGRKAFDGDSFATTLYRILQEEPEPLLHIDPNLPHDLVAIVERALAKARDERYQQMSDMLRDLAVVRQQISGFDTPLGAAPGSGGHARPSDPPRHASTPGSDAPTMAHGTTPYPPAPSRPASAPSPQPAPVTAASGSGVQPAATRRAVPIWIGIAAAVLVGVAAFAAWGTRSAQPSDPRPAAAPATPPPQAPAVDHAAVATALRQASEAVEAGDFDAAQRHAEAALAHVPDHPEARRVRERAMSARETVARDLREARAHFAAGRFEDASRTAGDVLSIVPGHAEAKRLMQDAAARSRGRGAEEARARMRQAKNAARAVDAASLATAAYEAALGAERAAQRLLDAGQLAEATAKFYEASGLFRSAELSAQTEAAARVERADAARAQRERDERERSAAATRAVPPPPPVQQAPPGPPPPSVPSGGRASEPPPAAGTPVPPPVPPKPAAPPEPSPESLVADLLARYEAALEARSLGALKKVWPGLDGAQESAIRAEFQQTTRINVEVISPRIEVAGGAATATFTRRYELVTTDGQRLSSQSLTTMSCRRTDAGWVIEQVRFEPR